MYIVIYVGKEGVILFFQEKEEYARKLENVMWKSTAVIAEEGRINESFTLANALA